jgi:hypothetical protein
VLKRSGASVKPQQQGHDAGPPHFQARSKQGYAALASIISKMNVHTLSKTNPSLLREGKQSGFGLAWKYISKFLT